MILTKILIVLNLKIKYLKNINVMMQDDNSHKNGFVTENCRTCLHYYDCEEELGKDFNPWSWCKKYIYDM